MHVSPLTIKIMIACCCGGSPAEEIGVSWNSRAGREIREWLEREGLIDSDERATDRGKAWVSHICETPLPELVWMRGDGKPRIQSPVYGSELVTQEQANEAARAALARRGPIAYGELSVEET